MAEHLLNKNGALTLFATHYFELTTLAKKHEAVDNAHVTACEHGDKVVFLHKVENGAANRSYGLQVAKLAGVPLSVVEQAHSFLAQFENGDKSTMPLFAPPPGPHPNPQPPSHPVVQKIMRRNRIIFHRDKHKTCFILSAQALITADND